MARLTKPKITIDLPEKPDFTRGGGAWPLKMDHVENWAWNDLVFTPEELDAIIQIGESAEMTKATTYGSRQSDKNRNSFVQFLYPGEFTNWVFARLASAITHMNDNYFGFDITGLEQGLQLTRYTAPGEHYDWHVDRGHLKPVRKLSLSIQLSDPADYEGGELQLKLGRKDITIDRQRGMATFFPSYTLHRVKPVKKGTRYSLVAWVSGPPFK